MPNNEVTTDTLKVRELEIPSLMTEQDEQIDFLISVCTELYGRLCPILHSQEDEVAHEKGPLVVESAQTEFGTHLEDNNKAIRKTSARLLDMLHRLEI